MPRVEQVANRIALLDAQAMRLARLRLDALTKPPGSLGQLETLAVTLAGITGQPRPRLARKAVLVFAADHGVASEGVSAYPAVVTGQMVRAFLAGHAAINVLAGRVGARVVVVDVGVAADLPPHPNLVRCRVAPGTASFTRGPAMTRAQALAAVEAGMAVLEWEVERGLDLVGIGEMGIGNTTAASALAAALTGLPVAAVTGRGTGVDDAGLQRKLAAIERALAANPVDPADPLGALAALGGLEIAGLVGVLLAAAARRLPVLLDGFITGAAALVAVGLCPAVRHYLIASHCSAEVGHPRVLERLGLRPLLALDLRLGEGTGAALAMPLVDAALAILDEMATFEEAGVSRADAPSG